MSKIVLVTGAAGFIGSHLCEQLIQSGYHVYGIDNFDSFYSRSIKEKNLSGIRNHPLFDFIEGDAGDQNVLNQFKNLPEIVIHLAAKAGVQPSLKNPGDYITTNILLTNNLLEWMKIKEIKKFIFASSSSVYGNTPVIPFVEIQQADFPFSPYAFTKRSCELMNYTYHDVYGLDIINLRFFTVYGERQRPDLAIYKFVNKIWNNEPIQIYGDGETSRDYTYWQDTVNGIQGAIEYITNHTKVFETINLGNHVPVKLRDLVNEIGIAMKIDPKIIYETKKPGDVDITCADITKAQNLLNYYPQTSLQKGLDLFFKWFKKDVIVTEKST
jgi:UDP-glucuronate 4-epimerase